jgi:outer membrane murein-binding lipoprotein Lpp
MRHEDLVIKHEQLTARVDELTRRVDELTRRVDELAARVDELTRRVDELAARVDDLTARLEQLAARVDQLAAQMAALVERVGRIEQDLGDLKGLSLEQYYRHNATAILGLFFQKLRVVDKGRLIDSLYDQRALTRQEWEQISKIDLLVKGLHRTTGAEHLLVWEISWTVDEEDVSRALERARLLRQRGLNTLPVVAGKGITGNARTLALSQGVLVLLDTVPLDGSGLA